MIVIDTNVLSEEMKLVPAASVHAWFRRQSTTDLFTTAVCEAEILAGIAVLPEGKRKSELATAAHEILALFAGRILPFDSAAAAAYAEIVAQRRSVGRPINEFDAQIAATVRSRNRVLATRNVSDFDGTGVPIIDPWAI